VTREALTGATFGRVADGIGSLPLQGNIVLQWAGRTVEYSAEGGANPTDFWAHLIGQMHEQILIG
jgi:hypothetical protein